MTVWLIGVLWSLVCFVAGCSWSLYRALGWEKRIRRWARTCSIEGVES